MWSSCLFFKTGIRTNLKWNYKVLPPSAHHCHSSHQIPYILPIPRSFPLLISLHLPISNDFSSIPLLPTPHLPLSLNLCPSPLHLFSPQFPTPHLPLFPYSLVSTRHVRLSSKSLLPHLISPSPFPLTLPNTSSPPLPLISPPHTSSPPLLRKNPF